MMSVANRPPIHRLNHDILLHIFEQNADMFKDDNSLTHTRTASQVCRSWRTLLLAMPFLWGKLLDFDALSQSAEYWWEELMRRTGDSLLWIKSRKPREGKLVKQSLALFLLKTIQDNLHHRIQILVLNLGGPEYWSNNAEWDKIGSFSVPQLRCFEFSVTHGVIGPMRRVPDEDFHPSASFTDGAPYLREFRAAQFSVNLQAPWFSGLCDLSIGYSNKLEDIFNALSTTQSLERLELHHVRFTDDLNSKTVKLPKLKELRFHTVYPMCDVLLDHLIIPPDCALHYTLKLSPAWFEHHEDNNFNVTLPVILRRLSKYARGYFLHSAPTDLLVHYEDKVLSITAHTQDNSSGFHQEKPVSEICKYML